MTKEERKEYNRIWYEANKKKQADYYKEYWDSEKDGLYTVYILPTHSYVGMTTRLKGRLYDHKNHNSRNVSDVQIIGKYKTKREALDVEAKYHNMGYNGKHPSQFKKKK